MPLEYEAWKNLEIKLEKFPKTLGEKVAKAATKNTKDYLKSKVKKNRNLVGSIMARAVSDDEWHVQSRGNPSKYDYYVSEGRDSFSAKKKKALHWIGDNGEDVFVMKPKKVAAFGGYQHYKHGADETVNSLDKYAKEALKEVGVT